MMLRFKGSAIHNLRILNSDKAGLEGLYLGVDIMSAADLYNGQEVIITSIGGDSWKNRIKTVVHASNKEGDATVSGSLTKFLNINDLTCLIAECYLNNEELNNYHSGNFPIVDIGFDPISNYDNRTYNICLQFRNKSMNNVSILSKDFAESIKNRKDLLRCVANSIILDVVVNQTHKDCLQGSAEIPSSILKQANIDEYKSVTVYNATYGGFAETYAVPMKEGVVMTTGAMATFAPIGTTVNIISFALSRKKLDLLITYTNGKNVILK